jgi:hypothetical protein
MRLFCLAVAVLLSTLSGAGADAVLLSTRRDGWLEAFRLDNLETAARVRIKERAEGVASAPDGQRFFVRVPHPQAPDVCCALYVLDARSLRAFAIVWPGFQPAIANGKLFTQRGDEGIDVFDVRSLMHLPTIVAPGVYGLAPSPNGHWLFGTRQFPTPALDIFDLDHLKMVRSIPVEHGQSLRGGCSAPKYYLAAPAGAGAGQLWPVSPDAESLGRPKLVKLGSAACAEPEYDVFASGDRIAIFSASGLMLNHGDCLGGGYLLVDPASGAVSSRLAPSLHFIRLIAGPEGKTLYGMVNDPGKSGVRLVELDAASGHTVASRILPEDVWTLSLGTIPAEWRGHVDLQAVFQ